MIERRYEPRALADFPVHVWGMDAEGDSFTQSALVRNLSGRGALLTGIEHDLRCGDVLHVRCGEKDARFRVIWVRDSGSPQQRIQAAVHLLPGETCPWSDQIARPAALDQS